MCVGRKGRLWIRSVWGLESGDERKGTEMSAIRHIHQTCKRNDSKLAVALKLRFPVRVNKRGGN